MKGSYFINIRNKKVKYNLIIDRQFTILRGNSSMGKSEFVSIISKYIKNKERGSIQTSKMITNFENIEVISSIRDWKNNASSIKNSLVIIDENLDFLFCNEEEFAKAVKKSDNYYLIVTRRPLGNIPYSIFSMYDFESKPKLEDGKMYTETTLKRWYFDEDDSSSLDLLITEDEGSGYYFFKNSLSCDVVAAGGKDKVLVTIKKYETEYKSIGVMIDSCGFGSSMFELVDYFTSSDSDTSIFLFLPESFEWAVLASKLFRSNDYIQNLLKEPYNFCETTRFFGIESMYTHYLKLACKENKLVYSKGSISSDGEMDFSKSKFMSIMLNNSKYIIASIKGFPIETVNGREKEGV